MSLSRHFKTDRYTWSFIVTFRELGARKEGWGEIRSFEVSEKASSMHDIFPLSSSFSSSSSSSPRYHLVYSLTLVTSALINPVFGDAPFCSRYALKQSGSLQGSYFTSKIAGTCP
eukprot:749447-Hanusia_phi.AAC.3